jgi:predicted S18 family serine protease
MPRDKLIQVRVDDAERAIIEENAAAAGKKPSVYLRELGLEPAKARVVTVAPSIAERVETEEVQAEVAEAALTDDPAEQSFLERRTRQLVGQGNTTRVARSLAKAEWRARGA